jgi:hypothetical protein
MPDTYLCPPAIIYLIFSLTQIIIDIIKGLYNTASVKVVVMVLVTFLLNILCKNGLSVVSWIIVFIPFILMTVIVSIILYVFGLNATTGSLNYNCLNLNTKLNESITIDASGNIIIYSPNYNQMNNPVYYIYPNIIVPNPNVIQNPQPVQPTQNINNQYPNNFIRSDYDYQS